MNVNQDKLIKEVKMKIQLFSALMAGVVSASFFFGTQSGPEKEEDKGLGKARANKVVRVAAVNTTLSTGLLRSLATDFQKKTGMTVEFLESETTTKKKKGRGKKLFDLVKNGEADLILAHYGKPEMEQFITEGYGQFPQLVFANQAALIGPSNDPAQIRGMKDASKALRKILETNNTFLVNKLKGQTYLSEMLWFSANQPEKAENYVYSSEQKSRAVKDAEKRNAYVSFGVQPFLHFKKKHKSKMEILVSADPMFQRPMATVVVKSNKVEGVNQEGAAKFQEYLLSASVQAKVKNYRLEGFDGQFWWPCARGNDPARLSTK